MQFTVFSEEHLRSSAQIWLLTHHYMSIPAVVQFQLKQEYGSMVQTVNQSSSSLSTLLITTQHLFKWRLQLTLCVVCSRLAVLK